MYQHILVPTDGSKRSEGAIKHAVALAKQLNAKLTVLHVAPKFHAFTYQMEMLQKTREEYDAARVAQGEQFLQFAARIASKAQLPCDTMRAVGDQPYKEIIKTAEKKKCDLILMASHGRRGVEGFLIGSETQKVLTHSHVPVLVYR